MTTIRLKVTITGFQTITAEDWLDNFYGERNLGEDGEFEPEALKAFAIACLITAYEDGDADPTDNLKDYSIEVIEVPETPTPTP